MVVKSIYLIISLLFVFNLQANNIKINKLNVNEQGLVRFVISWENAWNLTNEEPNNHDAAWVFIKIREKGGEWHSLNLAATYSLQSINNVFFHKLSENQAGFMLFPSNNGQFFLIEDEIEFYIDNLPLEFELKVFAIEMVYVPQSAYYLGDGISLNSFSNTNDSSSVYVENEDVISFSSIEENKTEFKLSESFPKGYNAFYAMKYEISQQQYVDFLNCLSFEAQQNRTNQSPASTSGTLAMANSIESRNGLVVSVSGNYFDKPAVYECNANSNSLFSEHDDAQNRAMNYLSWADLLAYLDWAGLRPLSELEFEKLARGYKIPVAGEMAWGTIYSQNAINVQEDGTENEHVVEFGNDSVGLANHGYNGVQGILRSGFAANENTGRVEAGAGYYGAFDLSGNLWEMFVAASFSDFLGSNGDGVISPEGFANQSDWPNIDAMCEIYRGGAWNSGVYEVGN